jgi:hypothetical protein
MRKATITDVPKAMCEDVFIFLISERLSVTTGYDDCDDDDDDNNNNNKFECFTTAESRLQESTDKKTLQNKNNTV